MKGRKIFAWLCAIPLSLFSSYNDLLINNYVNVCTRKLELQYEDLVVKGAVPFSIRRGYNGDKSYEDTKRWQLCGKWSFLPHTVMKVYFTPNWIYGHRICAVTIIEESGSPRLFYVEKGSKTFITLRPIQKPKIKLIESYSITVTIQEMIVYILI